MVACYGCWMHAASSEYLDSSFVCLCCHTADDEKCIHLSINAHDKEGSRTAKNWDKAHRNFSYAAFISDLLSMLSNKNGISKLEELESFFSSYRVSQQVLDRNSAKQFQNSWVCLHSTPFQNSDFADFARIWDFHIKLSILNLLEHPVQCTWWFRQGFLCTFQDQHNIFRRNASCMKYIRIWMHFDGRRLLLEGNEGIYAELTLPLLALLW